MSDANEILRKMREEKKAATKKVTDATSFYPRLLVFKLRRRQLSFAVALGFAVFITVIAEANHANQPWWVCCLPIVVVGLIICLLPPTEEWEYKPWQARPRQYERHLIER